MNAVVSSEAACLRWLTIEFLNRRSRFVCLIIYVETQSYGGQKHAAHTQQQSESAEIESSARTAAVCHFQQGGEDGRGQA